MTYAFWLLILALVAVVAIVVSRAPRRRPQGDPLADSLTQLEAHRERAAEAVNYAVRAIQEVERPLTVLRGEAQAWENRARETLAQGDEEGARQCLTRAVQTEQRAAPLEAQLHELRRVQRQAEEQYAQIRDTLEQSRARYHALGARQTLAEVGGEALDRDAAAGRTQQALDRLMSDVQAQEARAAAVQELAEGSARATPVGDEVEQRLAVLRREGA